MYAALRRFLSHRSVAPSGRDASCPSDGDTSFASDGGNSSTSHGDTSSDGSSSCCSVDTVTYKIDNIWHARMGSCVKIKRTRGLLHFYHWAMIVKPGTRGGPTRLFHFCTCLGLTSSPSLECCLRAVPHLVWMWSLCSK